MNALCDIGALQIVKIGGGALVAMAALTIPWMIFKGDGIEFLSMKKYVASQSLAPSPHPR
jgi:hypothetical protein